MEIIGTYLVQRNDDGEFLVIETASSERWRPLATTEAVGRYIAGDIEYRILEKNRSEEE